MEVLGKTIAAVDRVAVVDIAVDLVAADHTVWGLVVEVPAASVDHSEKTKKDSSRKLYCTSQNIKVHMNFIFLHCYKENYFCLDVSYTNG